MTRLHALLVAEELPTFQRAGHNVWLQNLIDFLGQQGAKVSLFVTTNRVGFVTKRKADLPFDLYGPGIGSIGRRYVITSPAKIGRTLSGEAFKRLPLEGQVAAAAVRARVRAARAFNAQLGEFPSQAMAHAIRELASSLEPTVIVFNSVFVYVPCGNRFRTAILAHDLVHERIESLRGQGYSVRPVGFGKAEELAILRRADVIIAIQPGEADRLRELLPGRRVLFAPVAMPPRERQGSPIPGNCIFVGSGALPNADGLQWFVDEVWPEVINRVPSATLHVYGTVCSRLRRTGPQIRLYGPVDDLGAAYDRAEAVVIPLRVGSGLKVKLVEAIMQGLPIITTSVGAQGLEGLRPQPFRVADSAADMAGQLVDVLTSQPVRAELSFAARRARHVFDPGSAFASLLREIHS